MKTRDISLEIVDLSLRLREGNPFKAYRRIERIQKLNGYLMDNIPFATHPELEVITYASNIANRSLLGNVIDPAMTWKKLHGLLAAMDESLT